MRGFRGSASCDSMEQELILFLYDEVSSDRRTEVEGHLRTCAGCTEDLASFRSVLDTIDRANLGQMATREGAGDWPSLRAMILSTGVPSHRPSVSPLLKAAAIVVLAGATFVLGRNWDSIAPDSLRDAFNLASASTAMVSPEGRTPQGSPEEHNTGWRLRVFSEETNGYLDRTRLVLLEVANTGGTPMPGPIREASRNLLRENPHARQVAGRIEDPRIEELVGQLEGILREIAQLSDTGDSTTIDRIRAYVNNSGVLLQLEIFSSASDRMAAARLDT